VLNVAAQYLNSSRSTVAIVHVGGLIFLQILGVYVDSSLGTLVPARCVPLDLSVVNCTVVLHSGKSVRVIPLFNGRCSADTLSPLVGIRAC
jgi:hypothetical protein